MKCRIHRNLCSRTLQHVVPRAYHHQVPWEDYHNTETLVLLFDHDRGDTVLSSDAERTLEFLGDITEPRRMAIAGNFAPEALNLLRASDFSMHCLGDFISLDNRTRGISQAS